MQPKENNRFYYSNTEFLNYEVIGSGPNAVVFLHGFGGSLRNWDDVLALLSKNDLTAYLLDLKGAGLSSKPHDSQYSIKDNADIVRRFIQEKKLENCTLVGHSFGGGVALLVALNTYVTSAPPPKGMVLLDTAAYKTELPFFVKYLRIPLVSRLLLPLLSSEFRARFCLQKIMYDPMKVSPKLVARYADFMGQNDYDSALIETAKDIIPEGFEEMTSAYPKIKCPVLVIWGRNDPVLPLSSGERLILELPNASLEVIENCGHNPHEEFPATVAVLISSRFTSKGV